MLDIIIDVLKTAATKTTEIKAKHEDILNIPVGKNFYDMPMKYYENLIRKKGAGPIQKALGNLVRWNKNKEPKISKKAIAIVEHLKKFDKNKKKKIEL